MGQLGRDGENKDVLNSLLSSNKDFNEIRRGPIVDKDSGFSSANATFFYRLSVLLKERFIGAISSTVTTMIRSDERTKLCSAVEIIAGVLRSLKDLTAPEVLHLL
jgi:hypothetical protein